MADISKIETIAKGLNEINSSSGAAVKALQEINDSILKTGNSLEGLSRSLSDVAGGMKSFGRGLKDISSVIPIVGNLGGIFETLGSSFSSTVTAVKTLADGLIDTIRIGDELTGAYRSVTASNYMLATQFGNTLDSAKDFTDFMGVSATKLASAEFGWQNFTTENIRMAEALANNKISFQKMREEISAGALTMDLYSLSILQAQALGLKQEDYARLMSDAIMNQGMSVQEATETMTLYGNIADETGLTVNTVSNSLNSLGNNFKKMGLDARFGQSFLKSFANSLKETGLGIENAGELAISFGETMAGLSTNYGSAFVTALHGGMSMGGSALGAGIQMQAKLMNKSLDQGEVGKEIGLAVGKTLADFTGGEIVTVQEAAASRDPRLEQAFYTQTELLKSIYGISDPQVAARTLEMLEELKNAQVMGNQQLAAETGEKLAEVIGARGETMSEEAKINAQLNATISDQMLQIGENTKALVEFQSALLSEEVFSKVTSGLESLSKSLQAELPNIQKTIGEYTAEAKAGKMSTLEAIASVGYEKPSLPGKIGETIEENIPGGPDNTWIGTLTRSILSVKITEGLETLPDAIASKISDALRPFLSTTSGGTSIAPGARH